MLTPIALVALLLGAFFVGVGYARPLLCPAILGACLLLAGFAVFGMVLMLGGPA